MTVIVGIAHRGEVWIGGDSAGVAGWSISTRADPKVFAKAGAVFGFSGSFRGGQLLRSSAFTVPDRHTDDVYDYMVTTFVDAVRDCLKTRGHAGKVNEEEHTDTRCLIGIGGRLFIIDSDYQVGESATGYDAIGCGSDIARGSLHTSSMWASLVPPRTRVELALKAASDHSGGVCPPFTILSGGN